MSLLDTIRNHGFSAVKEGWKKGKSSKIHHHFDLASIIDKNNFDLPKEIALLHTSLLESSKDRNTIMNDIDEFLESYCEYIKKPYGKVDLDIWGGLRFAVHHGSSIEFIAQKVSDNNEYVDLGATVSDIEKLFAQSIIVINGKSIPRASYFDYIAGELKSLLNAHSNFPESKEIFSNELLSPIIVRNLCKVKEIRNNDNETIGHRLVMNVKATLDDYYSASKSTISGSDIGRISIKSISNDRQVASFKHIDLNEFNIAGEYKQWNNFMNRFQHPEAKQVFMAWIWSIFYEKNRGAQAIYFHGGGNDGKSSVIQVLEEVLCEVSSTVNNKQLSDTFPIQNFLGKRLILYPDVKGTSFIHSEVFHSSTTGDPITLRRAYHGPEKVNIYVKHIMSGNSTLNMNTDETNQTRRIIYILMSKLSEDKMKYMASIGMGSIGNDGKFSYAMNIDEFKKELKVEFPYFLHDCRKSYEALCVNDGNIPLPKCMVDDLMKLNDPMNEEIRNILEHQYEMREFFQDMDSGNYENDKPLVDISVSVTYGELVATIVDKLKSVYQSKDIRYRISDILHNVYGKYNKSYRKRTKQGNSLMKSYLVFEQDDPFMPMKCLVSVDSYDSWSRS